MPASFAFITRLAPREADRQGLMVWTSAWPK
mgnify:CR=1 FL=1